MGIALSALTEIQQAGYLAKGAALLDIGSSNLYSASEEGIRSFLSHFGVKMPSDKVIQRLSKGSGYDPVRGGTNDSFVGELLELAGLEYLAFDIADGYKTEIFDLNRQEVSARDRERFDVVVNFGTTEHLLNQLNAFKTIHDACKVGGVMIHNLPACGWIDHGYITYTARFFFDLASCNGYEIERLSFEGPLPGKNLYDSSRDFLPYFPSLQKTLNQVKGSPLEHMIVPDIALTVYFKKVKADKFFTTMETTTSVGKIYLNEAKNRSLPQKAAIATLVKAAVNKLSSLKK